MTALTEHQARTIEREAVRRTEAAVAALGRTEDPIDAAYDKWREALSEVCPQYGVTVEEFCADRIATHEAAIAREHARAEAELGL